jgi:sulfate adenylyltransferase subunit 1 (EFTu-like GTPase family)
MTALHYEWSRAHQAIRLLLGVQLVNLAVEQMDPTRKEQE